MSPTSSQGTEPAPFKHLKDKLFLLSLSLWLAGRALKLCGNSPPLVSSYLNDVICIPFWLPIMTFTLSVLGLRPSEQRPTAFELVLSLVMFSIVFELVLPVVETFRGLAVQDPNDIVCYAAGAIVADEYWRRTYRRCEATHTG